jgi:hypothetical protein
LDEVFNWCCEQESRAPTKGCATFVESATVTTPGIGSNSSPKGAYCFKKVGGIWEVRYGAEFGNFRDSVGMRHISQLLGAPNRPLPAPFLAEGEKSGGRFASVKACNDFIRDNLTELEGTHEVIDEEAVAQYRARSRELTEELEEARKLNDYGKIAKLEPELELLVDELSQTTFQGRPKQFHSMRESARVAVRNALKRAYNQMKKSAQPMTNLVKHLQDSIKTEGHTYTYYPSRPEPSWEL